MHRARQFEPKPKWQSATPVMISSYKQKLDQLSVLSSIINVPADIISCYDLKCNTHTAFIECFYNDIVYAMINAVSLILNLIISTVLQGLGGMIT